MSERSEPTGLTDTEAAVVDRGRQWIRDNESTLLTLLSELVARPSISGTEGSHDDPATTVGHLAAFLESRLERSRLEYQRVGENERENCYSVLEGASEELLVCTSHTDIVPPGNSADWPAGEPYSLSRGTVERVEPERVELRVGDRVETRSIRTAYDRVWERRGGTNRRAILVGRGVYDNKASIVCLAGALLGLEAALSDAETDSDLDGTLVHGHLVGEEVAQEGAKAMSGTGTDPGWLPDRFPNPRGGIVVLDGAYGFVPAIGHRGLAWVTLRGDGESTHASTPHLGANAVVGVAHALAETQTETFRDALTEPFAADELLGELTVAAGTTIVGGDVRSVTDGVVDRGGINAVPDWCETTLDIRFPRWEGFPDRLDAVRAHLEETIASHAAQALDSSPADGSAISFEAAIDPAEFFPPVAIADSRQSARDHPLVATAIDATRQTFGYDPGVVVAPGVTDAASLYHGIHLPTLVEYGPAGAFSHEPLEFVEREQVVGGAEAMLAFTVRRLGLA